LSSKNHDDALKKAENASCSDEKAWYHTRILTSKLFILEPNKLLAANDPTEPEMGSGAMLVRHRLDALTHARLWRNPCGFAARFNYLSLRYNTPLYGWVEERFGLARAEFVILYSLGLFDGVTASEIAASTAFPKNTLSRAVNRIAKLGLIARSEARTDRRQQNLTLTPAGQAILDEAIPRFMAFEEEMLSPLSLVERETLSVLMAKVVLSMFDSQLQPSAEPAQP
jgi:MarR family transcriptional regulator, temperature-dependent positive regulator of motility